MKAQRGTLSLTLALDEGMGTGSFPGVKGPGRGADHPPPTSTGVKNE